jgi:F0F1-type ATP synthase assembly protein I
MEMALTVVVFLGLGWLADRALGTSPLFMVVLVVFAMIGQSARMWFTYDARMRTLEEERRNRAAGGQKHLTEIVPPTVGDLG